MRVLERAHRYIGLLAALPLLAMVLSGALILFRDELGHALYPTLTQAAAVGGRVPLSETIAMLARTFPGDALIFVELPQGPRDTHIATALDVHGVPTLIGVDTSSGAVTERMPMLANAVYFSLFLHTTLFVGPAVVGTFGLCLMLLATSGLTRWWPRGAIDLRSRLRMTFRLRPLRMARVHAATGIAMCLLLMLAGVTGVSMAFRATLQQLVDAVSLAPAKPQILSPASSVEDIRPSHFPGLVERAQLRFPLARPASVGYADPAGGRSVATVRLRQPGDRFRHGSTVVWFQGANGDVRLVHDPARDPWTWRILYESAWTLHTGAVLGAPGRFVMMVNGLAAAVMAVSGVLIWFGGRRQAPKRRPG